MNFQRILLLLSSLIEIITVAVTSIQIVLVKFNTSGPRVDASLVINIIVLLLLGFSVLFFLNGFFYRKCSEMSIYVATLFTMTVYVALDYALETGDSDYGHFKMIRLYAAGIGTSVIAVFSRWSSNDSRRIVGAADILLVMYNTRSHLLSVMKMDLVYLVVLGLLAYGIRVDEPFLIYTIIGSMLTFAFLKWLIGMTAVMKEIKSMVYMYVGLGMLGNLWIPLQLILISCFWSTKCTVSQIEYSVATLVASATAIFTQIYVYLELLKAYRNFDHGLTDRGFVRLVSESTSLLSGPRRGFFTC